MRIWGFIGGISSKIDRNSYGGVGLRGPDNLCFVKICILGFKDGISSKLSSFCLS